MREEEERRSSVEEQRQRLKRLEKEYCQHMERYQIAFVLILSTQIQRQREKQKENDKDYDNDKEKEYCQHMERYQPKDSDKDKKRNKKKMTITRKSILPTHGEVFMQMSDWIHFTSRPRGCIYKRSSM